MRADRLLGITLILLEKERMSASYLAETFEVSTRTIYRDVESLSMAGVPVFSTPGVGGGIRIMPGFKLEKGMFTNDDLSTMIMALAGLKDIVSQDVLASVEAKLRSLIPTQHVPYVQLKANCVRIDGSPWICNRDFDDRFALFREALNNHNPVRITYVNLRGEESRRVVISLRIRRSLAERVLDYCPYERFTPDGDDHYLVSFPFIDRDYYYDLLLFFGEDCEVLGPPSVRKKMAGKLERLSKRYTEAISTCNLNGCT